MKHMLLVGMIGAVSAAFGYSGLDTSLKELAVRFTDEAGNKDCFVMGSPTNHSADCWEHTKECVFDGYTWYEHQNDQGETVYDNQGYFEKGDATTEGWAGYQISKPMVVTRIRFWAGKDANWPERVERAQGVQLQAANTADFSDAVTLYTITEDKATLFKIVLGEMSTDKGELVIENSPRIGWTRQNPVPDTPDETLLEYSIRGIPGLSEMEAEMAELETDLQDPVKMKRYGELQTKFEHLGGYDIETRVKIALGGLGFTVEEFSKPFTSFSGGWRMRAELSRVLASKPDLLLLDGAEWGQTTFAGGIS